MEATWPKRSLADSRDLGEPTHRDRLGPSHPHIAYRPPAPQPAALEPPLIAVPRLDPATGDRDAAISGLTERYAAIWALADNGAKPDVIARATGQPIGQIELILGLRRQIDGHRTTISHASHRSA